MLPLFVTRPTRHALDFGGFTRTPCRRIVFDLCRPTSDSKAKPARQVNMVNPALQIAPPFRFPPAVRHAGGWQSSAHNVGERSGREEQHTDMNFSAIAHSGRSFRQDGVSIRNTHYVPVVHQTRRHKLPGLSNWRNWHMFRYPSFLHPGMRVRRYIQRRDRGHETPGSLAAHRLTI